MSAPQFIQHLTYAGERWDLLAWQYYGDPTNYSIIIMANPGVPIEPMFEAGIALAIPIIQQQGVLTGDLPPWKTTATILADERRDCISGPFVQLDTHIQWSEYYHGHIAHGFVDQLCRRAWRPLRRA